MEHLDAQPIDLLPETTLLHDPNALPSWEVPSPDQLIIPFQSSSSSIPSHDMPNDSILPFIPTTSPLHSDTTLPPTPIPQPPQPPITPPDPLTAMAPPALRCSNRIAAQSHQNTTALLAEYSPLWDSHELIHLSINTAFLLNVSDVHSVTSELADGSLKPCLEATDDPSWAEALASPKREYWIAGAKDKIKSLQDLQVFVLIPCSFMPTSCHPMRGKLVCK